MQNWNITINQVFIIAKFQCRKYSMYLPIFYWFYSFLQNQRKSIAAGMTGGASMFDRPGMGGSIAFRNSMTATLFSFNKENNTENSIGKKHALKKYDQFIRNTSCFCTVWFSQEHIFCYFNNGKRSIFDPEKSLKLPKILFFSVRKLHFW